MTNTVYIAAAVAGVPVIAVCAACGTEWRIPPNDTHADTLVDFGVAHRDCQREEN